jgi:single-strand DNA-binding protein
MASGPNGVVEGTIIVGTSSTNIFLETKMNNCSFIGNLTRDPEIRNFDGNKRVVNFSIAVNRKYKRGDEWVNEVAYLDMEAWDSAADHIAKWYSKGDSIVVSRASVKQDNWEDKATGAKRSKLKFRVDDFEFPPKSKERKPKDEQQATGGGSDAGFSSGDNGDAIPF